MTKIEKLGPTIPLSNGQGKRYILGAGAIISRDCAWKIDNGHWTPEHPQNKSNVSVMNRWTGSPIVGNHFICTHDIRRNPEKLGRYFKIVSIHAPIDVPIKERADKWFVMAANCTASGTLNTRFRANNMDLAIEQPKEKMPGLSDVNHRTWQRACVIDYGLLCELIENGYLSVVEGLSSKTLETNSEFFPDNKHWEAANVVPTAKVAPMDVVTEARTYSVGKTVTGLSIGLGARVNTLVKTLDERVMSMGPNLLDAQAIAEEIAELGGMLEQSGAGDDLREHQEIKKLGKLLSEYLLDIAKKMKHECSPVIAEASMAAKLNQFNRAVVESFQTIEYDAGSTAGKGLLTASVDGAEYRWFERLGYKTENGTWELTHTGPVPNGGGVSNKHTIQLTSTKYPVYLLSNNGLWAKYRETASFKIAERIKTKNLFADQLGRAWDAVNNQMLKNGFVRFGLTAKQDAAGVASFFPTDEKNQPLLLFAGFPEKSLQLNLTTTGFRQALGCGKLELFDFHGDLTELGTYIQNIEKALIEYYLSPKGE